MWSSCNDFTHQMFRITLTTVIKSYKIKCSGLLWWSYQIKCSGLLRWHKGDHPVDALPQQGNCKPVWFWNQLNSASVTICTTVIMLWKSNILLEVWTKSSSWCFTTTRWWQICSIQTSDFEITSTKLWIGLNAVASVAICAKFIKLLKKRHISLKISI